MILKIKNSGNTVVYLYSGMKYCFHAATWTQPESTLWSETSQRSRSAQLHFYEQVNPELKSRLAAARGWKKERWGATA